MWVAGGAAVFARMTRDTWRFGRFARHAKKAPDELVAEVAVVANRLGLRPPAVKKLAGLASPVMWCVGRPMLLWPADLDKQVTGDGRRAVIAHELAHLRRRDHWVRRLEMLAAVAHWWNPIFWLARRRLRADAEWACDEWAAAQADRRAYAEALLAVCSFQPRRRPAPAVGVLGEGKRDMQERLTLIMKPTTPSRAAYAAKLCVCLFGLAAVPAWTLGQAPAPAKPEATKAPDPDARPDLGALRLFSIAVPTMEEDAAAQAIQDQIKALTVKLEALRLKQQQAEFKVRLYGAGDRPAAAGEDLKRYEAELARAKAAADRANSATRFTELMKSVKAAGAQQKLIAGQNGVKVIGPDGKEIPGVIVIIDDRTGKVIAPAAKPLPPIAVTVPGGVPIVPGEHPGWPGYKPPGIEKAEPSGWTPLAKPQPTAAPGTMTLSRATYKLPKEQAALLATLLNGLKHAVIETKTDSDTLVVTTTPEAQAVVQRFVALLAGDTVYGYRADLKISPLTLPAETPLKVEFRLTDSPDDATFFRRVMLDLRGTLPTAEEIRAFVADQDTDKRTKLTNKLTDAKAVERGVRWLGIMQGSKAAELAPAPPGKPEPTKKP